MVICFISRICELLDCGSICSAGLLLLLGYQVLPLGCPHCIWSLSLISLLYYVTLCSILSRHPIMIESHGWILWCIGPTKVVLICFLDAWSTFCFSVWFFSKNFSIYSPLFRQKMGQFRGKGKVRWGVCMCVCSVAQSGPCLCDPMDCSPPGPLWTCQARILEWAAISSSRGSSWPRD